MTGERQEVEDEVNKLSLEFRERMTGFVTLDDPVDYETSFRQGRKADTRCDVSLTIRIPDMDEFVQDPKARADAEGYVDCPKLGGQLSVEKGHFNLLVDVIPSYQKFKDLRYRLLVRDPNGNHLTFSGVKFVDDTGIIYMWRDTTKLFTKIFWGDVAEGDEDKAKLAAVGILRLKSLELVKTLASVRCRPPGLGSWIRGNWLYFKLFAKRLWQVYGLTSTR